jgi:hypothetical protein
MHVHTKDFGLQVIPARKEHVRTNDEKETTASLYSLDRILTLWCLLTCSHDSIGLWRHYKKVLYKTSTIDECVGACTVEPDDRCSAAVHDHSKNDCYMFQTPDNLSNDFKNYLRKNDSDTKRW